MVPIMVEAKNGKEFNKPYPQNQHFSQYFANIDQWESIFQGFVEDAYETRFRSLKEITATPLRQNKANKIISFTIKIKEHEQYHSKMKEAYSVYFLHPTTKCSIDEGIDLIIKAESKDDSEKEPLPEWTKVILLPKEDNIATKIKTTISDIEVKTKEKESLEEEFENLMEFKHLLTSRDHQLEEVVKKALRTIGITVNPAKYSDEDGVIIDPKTENEIPIEIGGMNKGLTAEKVRQLIDWSEPFSTPDIKCKGLLIANPFREKQLDEDLNGRGKLAEENIIEKAVPWGLAIISTIDIFKAVRAKLNGEDISDFIQKIFNSTGIVTFNPTPTAPLSSPSDDVSAEDAPSA
ncbi:hypothetical protein JKY72_04830 [Candidatus Gracilibacteria bacterium]|nr:hypothetical protein [Candidatus Gracilibacteria bacterium]